MVCKNCGKEYKGKICPSCGTKATKADFKKFENGYQPPKSNSAVKGVMITVITIVFVFLAVFMMGFLGVIDIFPEKEEKPEQTTVEGYSYKEDDEDSATGIIKCTVVSAENSNTKVQYPNVTAVNVVSGREYYAQGEYEGYVELTVPEGDYRIIFTADEYNEVTWDNNFISAEDTTTPRNSLFVEGDTSNELGEIKMLPTRSTDYILGTYEGSYFAGQGEVGLTLEVYEDGGRYTAIFDFYNLPGESNSLEGSYYMDVSYDITNDEFNFKAVEWIEQPGSYSMIDLNGVFDFDNESLSGDDPYSFSVRKVY